MSRGHADSGYDRKNTGRPKKHFKSRLRREIESLQRAQEHADVAVAHQPPPAVVTASLGTGVVQSSKLTREANCASASPPASSVIAPQHSPDTAAVGTDEQRHEDRVRKTAAADGDNAETRLPAASVRTTTMLKESSSSGQTAILRDYHELARQAPKLPPSSRATGGAGGAHVPSAADFDLDDPETAESTASCDVAFAGVRAAMDGEDLRASSDTTAHDAFRQQVLLARSWQRGDCISVPLQAHASGVPCIAASASGKFVATASLDATVAVWPQESERDLVAKPLATLTGHIERIAAGAASGDLLATGDGSGRIIVWSFADAARNDIRAARAAVTTSETSAAGAIRCLDFAGNTIVAGGLNHLTLWRLSQQGRRISFADTAPFRGSASTAVLSDDGSQLLWSGRSPVLRLWGLGAADRFERRTLATLRGHPGKIKSTAWSGGMYAVSGDDKAHVKVWDVAAGRAVVSQQLFTEHPQEHAKLPRGSAAHTGTHLTSSGAGGVTVGDEDNATDETGGRWAGKCYAVDSALDRGTNLIAAGGNFSAVNVIDVRAPLRPALLVPAPAPVATVFQLKLLTECGVLLTGSNDGAVRSFDLRRVSTVLEELCPGIGIDDDRSVPERDASGADGWAALSPPEVVSAMVRPSWTLRNGERRDGAGGMTDASYWHTRDDTEVDECDGDIGTSGAAPRLWEPAPSVWTMEVVGGDSLWVGAVGSLVHRYKFGTSPETKLV